MLKNSDRESPSLEYRNAQTLSPSRRRHRHLDRMLDAVSPAGLLDQADGPLDGERRVVLEPEA